MASPLQATSWFIFQNDSLLLLKKDDTLPSETDFSSMTTCFLRHFNLGSFDDKAFHCAEIAPEAPLSNAYHAVPLRQALSLFGSDGYSLVIRAYSIINWDKNHQFCSRCGSGTVHQAKAFDRQCAACGLHFYPRISPSIIVLIKRDNRLLMARGPHFQPGVYSLIAGFVDTGETVEEAVHREVKEEVGLTIKNLSYFGSQPWPFPDSLMLAFTADYAAGEIVMDPIEIEDAGWYTHDNLPGLPSTALSIAMQLIEDFVSKSSRVNQ